MNFFFLLKTLDFSTNAVTKNWGGVLGANLSSSYLAFVGLSGYFISFVFVVWGYRILKHTAAKESYFDEKIPFFKTPTAKFVFFTFAIVSISSILSLLDYKYKIPEDWVTNSYGGHVGYMFRDNFEPFIGIVFYSFVFTVSAIFSSFVAFGISLESWMKFFRRVNFYVVSFLVFSFRKFKYYLSHLISLFGKSNSIVKEYSVGANIEEVRNTKISLKRNKKEATERKIISSEPEIKEKAKIKQESFDLEMRDSFQLPPLSILQIPDDHSATRPSEGSLTSNAEMLEKVLEDFGVKGSITEVQPGPVVTRYILEPAPGTKSSRVIGLADDIARSMTATSARISVVEGQNAIGIELPNSYRETVFLKELLASPEYKKNKAALPLSLGKDIAGNPVVIDLAKTPHLLVAGTTGSGKSVGLNAMILSLLYKYSG